MKKIKPFKPSKNTTRPQRTWLWALVLISTLSATVFATEREDGGGRGTYIADTRHNLSADAWGGQVRAKTESEICIFCHTPHGSSAVAPLWNRGSEGVVYAPYNSSTAKATFGQPTGSSKLCLSCHDGTVALGKVLSKSTDIEFAHGIVNMPSKRSNLTTDLSDDHPISFEYDASLASLNGELNDPSGLDITVKLDSGGMMQCTSCHDPHSDQFGSFLAMDNTRSALCTECHNKEHWLDSEHSTSTATWNGMDPNPWPNSEETTVADNACGNCHTSHDSGSGERLLNYAAEEQNCYNCHNSNVASTDIESVFRKISIHPIADTSGIHDPMENPVDPATRHVECADCHNPHAAKSDLTPATAPTASGAIAGVKGVDSSGVVIDQLNEEYELCYKCHADSVDAPIASPYINRNVPQANTRLEFDPSNESFHPIVTIGKNSNVPGLIAPWTENSMMYCSDCHNNDQGSNAGGSGPNGPHGSTYAPLLERNLRFVDGVDENQNDHALCYKCHDRNTLLDDNIGFPEHDLHLNNDPGAACTTCHDPHGSTESHLINFNLDYVQPLGGVLEYVSTGPGSGNCTLTCHGNDHSAESY